MIIIKKFKKFIFKNYLEKKLFMIGSSHFVKARVDYKNIKKISNTEFKIYSQNGEDGILDYLIYSLGIERPKFIEIGVGDYSESNTRFIFERTSPRGLIIDCIENFEFKVKQNIKLWRGELHIEEVLINKTNILPILKKNNFTDIDLFSIDIDGIDFWILNELPENFSKVAIIEYNAIFGHELEVTVPYHEKFKREEYHYSNLCYGMSLKAAINLMNKKNFYFVGTNALKNNAFFISNYYPTQKFFPNLVIESIQNATNSFLSESRDIKGELCYLKGDKKIREILDCEVIDLSEDKKKTTKLKNIIKI